MKKLIFNFMLFLLFCTSSCVSVQVVERQYLNDPAMQMDQDAGQEFSNYIHSIREAARPVSTAKGSGGCGCN